MEAAGEVGSFVLKLTMALCTIRGRSATGLPQDSAKLLDLAGQASKTLNSIFGLL